VCNATSAPPSSWSWYEKFHNIFKKTPKMICAVGGISHDQVRRFFTSHNNFVTRNKLCNCSGLLTLELKFFNICHLFFKDPKTFSIITLTKLMLLSYLFGLHNLNYDISIFFVNKYIKDM
jgi:hypothetical protein